VKSDTREGVCGVGIDRRTLTTAEAPVEQAVSGYIAAMPFLWLDIDDEPGPSSRRGSIERDAIALLSNHERAPLDPASLGWLGHFSERPLVQSSGLSDMSRRRTTRYFSTLWRNWSARVGAGHDRIH
jgi:hypothetical protein